MELTRRVVILIPAYKPDQRLVELVKALGGREYELIVVDDGSGKEYRNVFEKCESLNATVLKHEINRGKGRAIKTGLEYIRSIGEDRFAGIVTADADGQHLVKDIEAVAQKLLEHRDQGAVIIGMREIESDAPMRSRLGNMAARWIYRGMARVRIRDTQSGLRGFPMEYLSKMIEVEGERYEYEMNILLHFARWDIPFYELRIEGVYIDGNKGSHFRSFSDAWRIFVNILGFSASSLIGFAVDIAVYSALVRLGGFKVIPAYIAARLISATINFLINKKIVFRHRGNNASSAVKYVILMLAIMLIGFSATNMMVSLLNWSEILSKILADSVLFVLSYFIQHKFIFSRSG